MAPSSQRVEPPANPGRFRVSFTEKEYDYALERKKPAIGFIHGRPGLIPAERVEQSEELRTKLQAFLQKLKHRPVRAFLNPHEIALEITTSFVKLLRERPTEGYVRSSEAVEYKRYAALLEENNLLKEQLMATEKSLDTTIFKGHERTLKLNIELSRNIKGQREKQLVTVECKLAKIFNLVAEAILQNDVERLVLNLAAYLMLGPTSEGWMVDGFDRNSNSLIRRRLQLYGLVEISRETVSRTDPIQETSTAETVLVWRLTDYGRRQLRAMTGE